MRLARFISCGIAILGAVLLPAGCQKPMVPADYAVLIGDVVAKHADTSELSVRVRVYRAGRQVDETKFCVVTKDSELYVNDKFSSMEEIHVGDRVKLVGYYDPTPRLERFVVSFAYVEQPVPPPPWPDLRPQVDAAQPAGG